MKKKLIRERIIKTEEQSFSDNDVALIKSRRNKQLAFLVYSYLPLAAICLVLPGFLLFGLLTVFFLFYYLDSAAPLVKDAKQKKKLLLHFVPEKSDMSAFNRYFLSTPIFKQQQVEINKEDFYTIPNGSTVVLEMAANSNTVLRFTSNGKEIKVN